MIASRCEDAPGAEPLQGLVLVVVSEGRAPSGQIAVLASGCDELVDKLMSPLDTTTIGP